MKWESDARIAYMCVTAFLGVLVPVSYVRVFYRGRHAGDREWRGLKGGVLDVWFVSAALTCFSFLLTFVYWWGLVDADKTTVWGVAMEERWSTVGWVFVLFLLSANVWAWTFWRSEDASCSFSRVVNTLALWLTAAGAVGLFVLAIGTRDQDDVGWKQPMACVCGAVLAGHHLYMDAVFWGMTGVGYSQVPQ